ncbi:MAG TPA: O-antigen ligase family protein [Opitutaceae bacterium]|nr:O-antigen ligase family protein [Opitutaceae bacterium]
MANDRTLHAENNDLVGIVAVGHALLLEIFLAWRFGGMDPLGRRIAGCLCLAAPVVTLLAWRRAEKRVRARFRWIAAPLLLLALVVGVSALNPNMRLLTAGDTPVGFAPRTEHLRFLPSTVWPADTIVDFLFNAGLVLVGLNVFLAQPRRAHLRVLLALTAINAAILACAGSAFKLLHATAIFGTFPSPNRHFFASFFYYNHWGAFAVLGAAAAGALALHYRHHARDRWQDTPALFFGVLALLLLVSLPVSGARASSLAGLVLATVLALHARPRVEKGVRAFGPRVLLPLGIVAVVAGASAWLGREELRFVLRKTSTQLESLHTGGVADWRLPLYRDAWKLFEAEPVYGWGWHSFRYAFRRVQSFDAKMENEQKVPSLFLDAHDDWLQLLTELGLVGAALAVATMIGVGRAAGSRWWRLSPSLELATGFGCVGLLALVDFPFACPAVVVSAWTLLMAAAAIACDRELDARSR